jgi:PAS domain S-box-containing protein
MIHVLYVDDEPDLLALGKLFLEMAGGIEVDTAPSAQAALAMMEKKHYDAIVSDFQMPDMDGIAFLKQIRSFPENIAFILFTGKGREEVVIEALNNGADFYLQKGGDPRPQFMELQHKIRLAVQSRTTELELMKTNKQLLLANRTIQAAEEQLRHHCVALTESQQQLHENERRLFDIINFLPDATFAISADGVVLVWNRAVELMTGIPADQIVGKSNYAYALPFYGERRPMLLDLVLGFDEAIQCWYDQFTREGDRLTARVMIPELKCRKNVHLWFVASPLYDDDGKAIGAIETIRDVTEFAEVQHDLHRSEEKYRRIIENAGEGIVVIRDNRILYSNPAMRTILGVHAPEEVNGSNLTEFIHPEDRQRMQARNRTGLCGKLADRPVTFRIVNRDGHFRIVERRALLIEWENGPAALCFISDITGRDPAENSLLRENKKITLLYNISRHEIANHLTVLRGKIKQTKKLSKDPALLPHLNKIEAAAKEIFNNLEIARMYQEIGVNVQKWYMLGEILEQIVVQAGAAGIRCTTEVNNLEICADPLLPQVFFNLLDNSIRHGGHVTGLTITCQRSDRGMMVIWEDDGIGIPAPEKEQIFDQGFGKNTGLGLFLCREILAITGITLRENGVPGTGARFELLVPAGKYRTGGEPEVLPAGTT